MQTIPYVISSIITFLVLIDAKLSLNELNGMNANEYLELEVFNVLPWGEKDNILYAPGILERAPSTSSLPIVRIDGKIGEYDPCLVETFSKFNLSKVTEMNNVTMLDFSNGWIALVDESTVSSICNVRGKRPLHWFYGTYATLCAQNLGANALIWSVTGTRPELRTNDIPGDVNVQSKTVKNKQVNIPGIVLKLRVDEWWFQEKISDKMNNALQSPSWKAKIPFEVETNPFESIFDTRGLYCLTWVLIGIFSFVFSLYLIYKIMDLVKVYRSAMIENKSGKLKRKTFLQRNSTRTTMRGPAGAGKNNHKMNKNTAVLILKLLILIPELVNFIARVIIALVWSADFFVKDYFVGRIFSSLSFTLSTFTDIITVLYCYDVYVIFAASMKMKRCETFLLKHTWGGPLLILASFLMVVLDQLILNYSFFVSDLGVIGIVVPLMYLIITNITVTVILFQMTGKMKKVLLEVNKSHKRQKNTITRFFLKRRLFLLAAWGRLVMIGFVFLIGGRWHFRSDVNYAVTFIGFAISSLVSSVAQVQATLERKSGDGGQVAHNGDISLSKPTPTKFNVDDRVSTVAISSKQ